MNFEMPLKIVLLRQFGVLSGSEKLYSPYLVREQQFISVLSESFTLFISSVIAKIQALLNRINLVC